MSSIFDFFERNWVLSLLLIVVFGYFLGITISTTVDYRLRDATIQMPTPKQTIIVNMNSKKTSEFFNDMDAETQSNDNSDEDTNISEKKKRKSKKVMKEMKKEETIDDSSAYENFMNKTRLSDPADDEFITSSSYAPSSHKDIPDTAQRAYALSYRIAEGLSKFPFPFKAYNSDENAQQFSRFVSK
jgi:hypothetical protein